MTAPRPATPESEPCVAVTEGYFCTLAASHEGDHIAHGFDGSVRYRWPAVTPEREPPSKWRFQDGKVIPMTEPCPNPDCIGPGCAVCKQVTVTFSPATPSEPPPHEHSTHICGGDDNLSEESKAEIQGFTEYLKDKAARIREGRALTTYQEWRKAR